MLAVQSWFVDPPSFRSANSTGNTLSLHKFYDGESRAELLKGLREMGSAYDFLSKWTRIDELLAPYNAAIFEKVAAGHGGTLMAVGAVAGVLLGSFAVAVTSPVAFTLMQRAYLAAKGIETRATVVSVVVDPPTRRGTSNWARLDYVFETHRGEKIADSIRRAPWEFTGMGRGRQMEMVYAERWPSINLPRVGFGNSGYLAFNCFLGLLFSVHILLFLIRYRSWRKRTATLMKPGVIRNDTIDLRK